MTGIYPRSVTLSIGFFRSTKSYKNPRFSVDFCRLDGAYVGNVSPAKRRERIFFEARIGPVSAAANPAAPPRVAAAHPPPPLSPSPGS